MGQFGFKEVIGVIVTYNPDSNLERNLRLLLSQVNSVVIIDNNSDSILLTYIRKLVSNYVGDTRVTIIENDENLGIAKALNQGCIFARKNKFEYSLLLDQDSLISEGMVESLFGLISCVSGRSIVSPNIISQSTENSHDEIPSRYFLATDSFRFKRSAVESSHLDVLFNITSGSLVDLRVWNEVGGFLEDLFIEGVDNEYGLRCNMLGYKVTVDKNSYLRQVYGNQKVRYFLGFKFYPTYHSPLRHFYVSRNRVLIWRKYWKVYPSYLAWDFLSLFKTLLQIVLFEDNKLKKLGYSFKGLISGIKGDVGRFDT